jgi:hypothetical protein
MQRRVDFQHDAARPPGFARTEVLNTGTGAGDEGLPVVERGVHLGVPRHGVNAVLFQPDDRSRLAQPLVERIRIVGEGFGERVDVDAGRFDLGCGGHWPLPSRPGFAPLNPG